MSTELKIKKFAGDFQKQQDKFDLQKLKNAINEVLKIKGFDPLIATIFENKKPRPKFKEIDEDLLENILERVLNISDFNAHLCFEIATYLFSLLEHSTDGTFSNPSFFHVVAVFFYP